MVNKLCWIILNIFDKRQHNRPAGKQLTEWKSPNKAAQAGHLYILQHLEQKRCYKNGYRKNTRYICNLSNHFAFLTHSKYIILHGYKQDYYFRRWDTIAQTYQKLYNIFPN